MSNPDEATDLDAGAAALAARPDDLDLRMQHLRDGDLLGGPPSLRVAANLETAYEELRVADEEVRAQQEQIVRLLERHGDLQKQHERMLAMLPVPALVTDVAGGIRSANAAAAALASVRVATLVGKPVFSLFAVADRRRLRDLLTAGFASVPHRTAAVVPRDGAPVPVEVSVTVGEGDPVEVTWVLLGAGGAEPERRLRELPEALTELAGLPGPEVDVRDVLHRAGEICRRAIGEVEVSICLGAPDAPDAVSSTAQLAQTIDGAQLSAGEGPCRAAFESRQPIRSPDLAADLRWPRLSRLLPPQQVSTVVVPIEVQQRWAGALNVYGSWADQDVFVTETAGLLAATLGAVFHELELTAELDRLADDMRRAVSSRAVIEQAKGIVMAQKGCGPDEAFAHLAQLSSAHERKLRDVARTIVDQASNGG